MMERLSVLVGALLAILLPVRMWVAAMDFRVQLSPADALIVAYLVVAWKDGGTVALGRLPRRVGWLLAAASVWLGVAFLIGWYGQGHLIAWAFVNKLMGWGILLAYGAAGLTMAGRDADRVAFLRSLLVSTAAVSLVSAICYTFLPAGNPAISKLLLMDNNRFAGLTGNPNAFSFLSGCLAVCLLSLSAVGMLFGRRADTLVLAFLLLGLIFAGSRSGWVAAVIGIAGIAVLRHCQWRVAFHSMVLAAVMAWSLAQLPRALFPSSDPILTTAYVAQSGQNQQILSLRDTGVQERLQTSAAALRLWQESPVFGVGLGVFLDRQVQQRAPLPAVIHTTALWLLTETGIVGLALMLALFVSIVWTLWSHRSGLLSVYAVAGLGTLLVFSATSLFNEMLYQRFFWILVAVAIGTTVAGKAAQGDQHEL